MDVGADFRHGAGTKQEMHHPHLESFWGLAYGVFSVGLQVFHLTEAGIGCAYLSGGMEWQDVTAVYDKMRCCSPDNAVILFITPEKVGRPAWVAV